MNVYVIIESKGVDYHGTYKEIIAVYKDENKVKTKIKELEEENTDYRIEYDYHVYSVIQ